MRNCIYQKCLGSKEEAVLVELFAGFLVALAATAVMAILVPSEQEFCRLGNGSMTRQYSLAATLLISLLVFGLRAIRKSLVWCQSCKKAGKPLCYCGGTLVVETKYEFLSLLPMVVTSGLMGKCVKCDCIFPIGLQRKFRLEGK